MDSGSKWGAKGVADIFTEYVLLLAFCLRNDFQLWKLVVAYALLSRLHQVYLGACLLSGLFSSLFLLEKSPPLYHVYSATTIFLWAQIFSNIQFILTAWRSFSGKRYITVVKLCCACFVALFILEFLVSMFHFVTVCFMENYMILI